MKSWVQAFEDRKRTALIDFKIINAIHNNQDYSHLIEILKTINMNTFRLGKINKWKALYKWIMPLNEEQLKMYNSSMNYEHISREIKDICKKVVKREF